MSTRSKKTISVDELFEEIDPASPLNEKERRSRRKGQRSEPTLACTLQIQQSGQGCEPCGPSFVLRFSVPTRLLKLLFSKAVVEGEIHGLIVEQDELDA